MTFGWRFSHNLRQKVFGFILQNYFSTEAINHLISAKTFGRRILGTFMQGDESFFKWPSAKGLFTTLGRRFLFFFAKLMLRIEAINHLIYAKTVGRRILETCMQGDESFSQTTFFGGRFFGNLQPVFWQNHFLHWSHLTKLVFSTKKQ